MYKKYELKRYVRFYINGEIVFSSIMDYDLQISNFCKSFCVSPDVVIKRVSFKLAPFDLPF